VRPHEKQFHRFSSRLTWAEAVMSTCSGQWALVQPFDA